MAGRPNLSIARRSRTVSGERVRGVRGAVQVARDDAPTIVAGTAELMTEILRRNGLGRDDVISVLFTTTADLTSCYPAVAARDIGLGDVPLMCATEIAVPRSLPRVVRVLAHVYTTRSAAAVEHVYLRGAAVLRPDLSQRVGSS
jgi:chorismate mutase